MEITINNKEYEDKHWDKDCIESTCKKLDLSYIGALFYLYSFNNVRISQEDLKEDFGTEMYRKFAKGFEEFIGNNEI